ncbi:MAG TPA: hypothetical protein VLB67_15010 [Acidimicrobiia bacterium]|nr:hypothetical protein [Acidimicrobiia bacterium]
MTAHLADPPTQASSFGAALTPRRLARRSVLSLVLLLAACGGQDGATTTTDAPAAQVPPSDAVAVVITDVEISSSRIIVRGEAPTPCNDLGSILRQDGTSIDVVVWAEPLADGEACAQVITPFEVSSSFDTPEQATPVVVNGEQVGRTGG